MNFAFYWGCGMKAQSILVAKLATLAVLTGCSVDVSKDGETTGKRLSVSSDDRSFSRDSASCHFISGRGCLNGHAGAMQGFLVDGTEFFNADDLASRLHELLRVESEGKLIAKGTDGYRLALTTPLDNDSFISGFRYDLSGQVARSGELHRDGSFTSNDLPAGDYQLRIQRAVRFQLITTLKSADKTPSDQAPATPKDADASLPANIHTISAPATAATRSEPKLYCATLYSDNMISVNENQSAWVNINNFRLHVTTQECAQGETQTTLHL